jgi:nucleoside-diphosphate-sugar epimerase
MNKPYAFPKLRILVTGAGGFVGSHLVRMLAQTGARVTGLVHYNAGGSWGLLDTWNVRQSESLRVQSGDITDPAFCTRLCKDQDIIVHCAASISVPYSYIAPQVYRQTNVSGTKNLMASAVKHRIKRFIHASTSEVYGDAGSAPIDESHRLNPSSPYAESKIQAERIVRSFAASGHIPFTILRPFNTFGPGQSTRAIIPSIISQVLSARSPDIKVGAVSSRRDFTYISDMIDAYLRILTTPETIGETINVGSGKSRSIREIHTHITGITRIQKPLVLDPARSRPHSGEITNQISDSSKLGSLTGWNPVIPFEDGLKKTIVWMRSHLHLYKPELYAI